MENQVKNLESMSNFDDMKEIVSASEIIQKLENTLERLTKENEELLSHKGRNFIRKNLLDKAKISFY